MTTEIKWVSVRGEVFSLWPPRGGVFLEADSIDGLVASFADSGVVAAGLPGQTFILGDRVVDPMQGSFRVCVESVEDWREFRRSFSTKLQGHLMVGEFRLPCRLSASLAAPGTEPRRGSTVEIHVIADGGVWLSHFEEIGAVTVTNWGDVPVSPEIVWEGAGGQVSLPSGAKITLPAVTDKHVMSMDRRRSGLIRKPDGSVDRALSAGVDAVGESVPIGAEKVYSLPAGAVLAWDVGVFDAWSEVKWTSNSGVTTLTKL